MRGVCCRCPVLPRSPCFSDSAGLADEEEMAGAIPKRRPVINGDSEAEREHLTIESDLFETLETWGSHRHEQRNRPGGKERSDNSTNHRQEHALGEQLPDQPGAARAHRRPDRNFPRSGRGAREQKIRDVCAANKKQKPDRCEKKKQHRPDAADHVFMQRSDADAGIQVIVWILVLRAAARWRPSRRALFQGSRPVSNGAQTSR